MTILYLEWNSYCNEDMFIVLQKMECQLVRVPFDDSPNHKDNFLESRMDEAIKGKFIDFVFSFNYFPPVSDYCLQRGLKYVAWVYDSPYVNVYSYTLTNSCNYVFLFDKDFYLEFKSRGIDTVYYLPMAVNIERLDGMIPARSTRQILDTDVAFVGSLYTERKHDLYTKFENINPYIKGYLEGIIQAQLKVYGYNFIQEVLTKDIIEEMKRVYTIYTDYPGTATEEYMYGDYVLSKRVTALERREIVSMLSQKYSVQIHTNDENAVIGKAKNMGPVNYYNGMPYVFKCAKINLNITLRSIKSGIPLRAMDIMGCGGFLMTNYQADFMDFFVPGEDFVFYEDYNDLMRKAEYYLIHDEERMRIARNGHEKMKKHHTLEQRVKEILRVLEGEGR